MRDWLWNLLVSLDQLLNVFLRGQCGETLSGRAFTAMVQNKPWGCVLCKLLGKLKANHCEDARQSDIVRAEAVLRG